MGKLVAAGGIYVASEHINALERVLNQLAVDHGFPSGEEFKWSPGREDWMRQGLVGPARSRFCTAVIEHCSQRGVRVTVVICDTESRIPPRYRTHEAFATELLIERIEWMASRAGRDVLIVFDRPGGARAEEETFLGQCLDTIQEGTPFVRPARIALNALSTSSHFVRLLQAADLFTGIVTSYVSGEARYSPPYIPGLRPMIAGEPGRVGGFGIKLHPDFRYANLYHWLFGDEYLWRGNLGIPLPIPDRPFSRNERER